MLEQSVHFRSIKASKAVSAEVTSSLVWPGVDENKMTFTALSVALHFILLTFGGYLSSTLFVLQ